MKELALLMFFVGCGYALAKLIERFSPADGRRIFFAIPSQASFNVLWGFVFSVFLVFDIYFWVCFGFIIFFLDFIFFMFSYFIDFDVYE